MKYFVALILLASLFAIFVVFPVMAQPEPVNCGSSYTVQPGDHLMEIARLCGVNYRDLLAVNPQITNPDLIYAGDVILFPNGSTTQVVTTNIIPVTASSAPAVVVNSPTMSVMPAVGVIGSTVTISASGFQANQPVEIHFGMAGNAFYQLATAITDANGAVYGQYQIPNWPNVDNQDGQYTFVVAQMNQPSIRAVSSPFSLTGTGNVVSNQAPVGRNNLYYMVQEGDTLVSIAVKNGTTTDVLIALNPALGTTGAVFPGMLIYLPA